LKSISFCRKPETKRHYFFAIYVAIPGGSFCSAFRRNYDFNNKFFDILFPFLITGFGLLYTYMFNKDFGDGEGASFAQPERSHVNWSCLQKIYGLVWADSGLFFFYFRSVCGEPTVTVKRCRMETSGEQNLQNKLHQRLLIFKVKKRKLLLK
jgi:hypothetical protein